MLTFMSTAISCHMLTFYKSKQNIPSIYFSLVMNIRSRPMFFAERLRDSMKGLGTDERTLIRIIVSRSEVKI